MAQKSVLTGVKGYYFKHGVVEYETNKMFPLYEGCSISTLNSFYGATSALTLKGTVKGAGDTWVESLTLPGYSYNGTSKEWITPGTFPQFNNLMDDFPSTRDGSILSFLPDIVYILKKDTVSNRLELWDEYDSLLRIMPAYQFKDGVVPRRLIFELQGGGGGGCGAGVSNFFQGTGGAGGGYFLGIINLDNFTELKFKVGKGGTGGVGGGGGTSWHGEDGGATYLTGRKSGSQTNLPIVSCAGGTGSSARNSTNATPGGVNIVAAVGDNKDILMALYYRDGASIGTTSLTYPQVSSSTSYTSGINKHPRAGKLYWGWLTYVGDALIGGGPSCSGSAGEISSPQGRGDSGGVGAGGDGGKWSTFDGGWWSGGHGGNGAINIYY